MGPNGAGGPSEIWRKLNRNGAHNSKLRGSLTPLQGWVGLVAPADLKPWEHKPFM